MKLLEDGTLVVETAEQVKKIKRVIVLQEGTHTAGCITRNRGKNDRKRYRVLHGYYIRIYLRVLHRLCVRG